MPPPNEIEELADELVAIIESMNTDKPEELHRIMYHDEARLIARHTIIKESELIIKELETVRDIPGKNLYLLDRIEELTNKIKELRDDKR